MEHSIQSTKYDGVKRRTKRLNKETNDFIILIFQLK